MSGYIEEHMGTIQGYSVQYIFEIIKMIRYRLYEIESQIYIMPRTHKFSTILQIMRPYETRRKKNWLNA